MASVSDSPLPPSPNGKEAVAPASRGEWREWLAARPDRQEGVWVVHRKARSGLEGPVYDDLVEEALCFGWIDGQARGVDEERTMLWFSPRRRGSFWARSNKERIERLEARGLMTERGRAVVDAARADGTWSLADDVEALVVPPDLGSALAATPGAEAAFHGLGESRRKQDLWWVVSARRSETRARRIADLVRRLSEGE